MKVLWLVSWYPNRNDRFDGDFIQRHARAVAIRHNVHVIFVTDAAMKKEKEEEWNYAAGLTEQIIYFRRRDRFPGKLRKQWLWQKLFKEAVNKYISQNGLPDIVHVHVPWKAGIIALWMKRKYGIRYVVSEHWGVYNKYGPGNFFTRSRLTRMLWRRIYQNAKTLSTVSRFLANEIGETIGRTPAHIIPNVVDTALFFYKNDKYSKFTFIHVSNMVKVKNAGSILKAFQKLIEMTDIPVQLLMIGNREDEYLNLARSLGLLNTSVFFRGEIGYAEVAEEMKRSHCLVLFSDSETFSCVTAEALCCGLPVVASDVGALPELVNGTDGVLVPAKDERALATAMQQMIEKYPSFRHGQIAAEASKKYNYGVIAQFFDDLYTTALK